MNDVVTGAGTEVQIETDLPPERVWALVTDVTRIGEWSPECVHAGWLTGDGRPPRAGDRFEARNEYPGGFTATVECVVTEADALKVFAWVVLDDEQDPDRPGSCWRYRLTSTAEGTLVTHTFTHGPGLTGMREGVHAYPERAADVIAGRLRQLHGNMTTTLRTMLEARMKFMLFVCIDREAYDRHLAQSPPREVDEPMPWVDDLAAAGIWLDGDELRPYSAATTVRVRGGEVLLADGPFAETREVIVGYDIIECADLDQAIKIAADHPVAQGGVIEIRPFRS